MPSDPSKYHKTITDAELREMEECIEDANNAESTEDWIGVAEEGVIKHMPRLIAEVRRIRALVGEIKREADEAATDYDAAQGEHLTRIAVIADEALGQ